MTDFILGRIIRMANTLQRDIKLTGHASTDAFTALSDALTEYVAQSPKIEDQMIWMAMRYALGRRTYAAAEAAQYVTAHWGDIDERIRAGMIRDIREAMKRHDTGDACDTAQWQSVLDLNAQKTYKGKVTTEKVYACRCGGTVRYKTDGHGQMHWDCDSCDWDHYGRIMVYGASGAFDQKGTDAYVDGN
jgi:hypothetical protein